jgi:hypothetical protein
MGAKAGDFAELLAGYSPPLPTGPRRDLQLFLTRRCQLRCRYCPVRKKDEDLPLELAFKAVDFLLGSQSPDVTLEFYGGEPLLAFDVMRRTVDYAAGRARALGKKIRFFTATNAIALDEEKLAWMARHRFLVELSWDGSPKTHNLLRKGPGQADSYRAMRRIVSRVLRSGVDLTVIVVTIPKTAGRLAENIEHLLGLGIRSLDLSYAIGVYWPLPAQRSYCDGLRRAATRHEKDIRSGGLRIGNLWPQLEPSLINPALAVDTDGSLHVIGEILLEKRPPDAPSPLGLGNVRDIPDINAIGVSQFDCARALLRMYARSPQARRVILNNIAFGSQLARFCVRLRESLGA